MVEISSDGGNTVAQVRSPYEQPTLRVFGSLQLLTKGSLTNNGDAGNAMMAPPQSDPRVKENIVEVGRHPMGFGLFLFDYKSGHGSPGRQFGVMADEVEVISPDAVVTGADGYKRVYYNLLGIKLNG